MAYGLKDKTLFITGASRGIGLEIAKAAAREGANIVIAAKTDEPHRHLPGTIFTAAAEIEAAGGQALPLKVDIRSEDQVADAVERAVARFGGIDVCVNNASAIYQATTVETDMKRYDLVHDVVARAAFMVTKFCVPHLLKAENPHVLMFAPRPVMDADHLARSLHQTIAKYTAGMCVIGMAEEFREQGIAVNSLRPRTWIGTSAIRFRRGNEGVAHSRKPEIMADASIAIFKRPSREFTGQFAIDDEILYADGVRDFELYSVDPTQPLYLSGMSKDDPIPSYLSGIIHPPGAMGENAREIVVEEAQS